MTKPDSTRDLSIEQLNAIELLLSGQSDSEVASAVGTARQTVCNWRNHHPEFRAELNRRRKELWQGNSDKLRDGAQSDRPPRERAGNR